MSWSWPKDHPHLFIVQGFLKTIRNYEWIFCDLKSNMAAYHHHIEHREHNAGCVSLWFVICVETCSFCEWAHICACILCLKTYLCAFKHTLSWHFYQSSTTSLKHCLRFMSAWSHLTAPCDMPPPAQEPLAFLSLILFWLHTSPLQQHSQMHTYIHACIQRAKNKQLLMGRWRVSSAWSRSPLARSSRQV